MGANTPEELRYVADVVCAPLVTVIQEAPPTTLLTDEVLKSVGCVFALHAGGPADRAKVAKYCIQDCDLARRHRFILQDWTHS